MAYSCCFSLGGNLDFPEFLHNKFYSINYWPETSWSQNGTKQRVTNTVSSTMSRSKCNIKTRIARVSRPQEHVKNSQDCFRLQSKIKFIWIKQSIFFKIVSNNWHFRRKLCFWTIGSGHYNPNIALSRFLMAQHIIKILSTTLLSSQPWLLSSQFFVHWKRLSLIKTDIAVKTKRG